VKGEGRAASWGQGWNSDGLLGGKGQDRNTRERTVKKKGTVFVGGSIVIEVHDGKGVEEKWEGGGKEQNRGKGGAVCAVFSGVWSVGARAIFLRWGGKKGQCKNLCCVQGDKKKSGVQKKWWQVCWNTLGRKGAKESFQEPGDRNNQKKRIRRKIRFLK